MTEKQSPPLILRNLDNFPPGGFIRTSLATSPPPTIRHKRVVWKIDGETQAFPHMMKYTIGWESNGKKD